jgi:hypothetical protein
MIKRPKKRLFKFLFFNEKGITLVESLGGLVILALSLVIIYSGFITAQKIIDHGNMLEEQSQDAYASLEKGTALSGDQDTLEIALGNESVSISGQYNVVYEEETNAALYTFETAGAQNSMSIADEVRDTFLYWIDTFNTMNETERVANGYPRFVTNSDCRTWVSENIYEGSWPTMDTSFLDRNGITLSPFYVQPYYYAATGDVFIFAKDTYGDSWYTKYVYDHEEQTWYSYSGSGVSINRDWATVKSWIHTGNWLALN